MSKSQPVLQNIWLGSAMKYQLVVLPDDSYYSLLEQIACQIDQDDNFALAIACKDFLLCDIDTGEHIDPFSKISSLHRNNVMVLLKGSNVQDCLVSLKQHLSPVPNLKKEQVEGGLLVLHLHAFKHFCFSDYHKVMLNKYGLFIRCSLGMNSSQYETGGCRDFQTTANASHQNSVEAFWNGSETSSGQLSLPLTKCCKHTTSLHLDVLCGLIVISTFSIDLGDLLMGAPLISCEMLPMWFHSDGQDNEREVQAQIRIGMSYQCQQPVKADPEMMNQSKYSDDLQRLNSIMEEQLPETNNSEDTEVKLLEEAKQSLDAVDNHWSSAESIIQCLNLEKNRAMKIPLKKSNNPGIMLYTERDNQVETEEPQSKCTSEKQQRKIEKQNEALWDIYHFGISNLVDNGSRRRRYSECSSSRSRNWSTHSLDNLIEDEALLKRNISSNKGVALFQKRDFLMKNQRSFSLASQFHASLESFGDSLILDNVNNRPYNQPKSSISKSKNVKKPIQVGQFVQIGKCRGTIQFIGETHFATGDWVGIELCEPLGKNNGSIKGERYFRCKENHGIFVKLSSFKKV